MKIGADSIVILTLHSPKERHIGVFHEVTAAGVFIRSVELDHFDEWSREIAAGNVFNKLSEAFFPIWRVERIDLDAPLGEAPSTDELFRRRTGHDLASF
jgi:hypothetical protein